MSNILSVEKEWLIAPGPASVDLASKVAEKMKVGYVQINTNIFPDGENYFRVNNDVMNKRVALIQSTHPPTDKHIIQLLFLAHKLNENGAEVYAIIPYLAYARQHKMFLNGEIISLGVFAHLLRSVGVKKVITFDIHNIEGLGLFSIPCYSLSAIPLIADYFKKNYQLKETIAISPDLGGSNRVEAFAKILGIEYLSLTKIRDKVTGNISIKTMYTNVKNKDIILIDDIVSSGKTMELAVLKLKDSGAGRIFITCVHPLLTIDSIDRIKKAGIEDFISTNTIPSSISKIDISPIISSHLSTL